MKKVIIVALAFAALIVGCQGKPSLVLYTWSEMFPPEIIKSFEEDCGIKVKYVVFDTNEAMFARLQAAKGGKYDLVIADDYMIENIILEGLAQKLDISKIPNYRNINALYQQQFYDPADEYTVPYGAGVQTIVYDSQRVNFPISGYMDLWHPELKNSIGIVDSFRVVNGMALKVMDQSYNTNDIELIRTAGEYLKALAPNIRLIRDDKLEEELLSGEISVGVMYTSQVTMAKLENPDLEVVFPDEGLGFGIMAGFIPVNAANPDAACVFLNYILDAERGARCFEYLGYYSTYAASDSLIDPEYKDFLTLPEEFGVMEMIQNVSAEAEAMHNRIWTEFKSASGR
jgi:spermidine/putrescine-binding protein